MQTAAQIKTQIAQVQGEMFDIKRSLPRLTSTTDLLDANQELANRDAVIKLLDERLQEAREREAEQEKQRKRQALIDAQAEAREACDELTQSFENELQPILNHIAEKLPRLRELALKRGEQNSKYGNAAFDLRGGTASWSTSDELTGAFGWTVAGYDDRPEIRGALYTLFRATLGSASTGLENSTRPTQYHDDTAQQAITDEVNRYFDRSE